GIASSAKVDHWYDSKPEYEGQCSHQQAIDALRWIRISHVFDEEITEQHGMRDDGDQDSIECTGQHIEKVKYCNREKCECGTEQCDACCPFLSKPHCECAFAYGLIRLV